MLCHDGLLRDILESRITGKPTRGRKRLHMIMTNSMVKTYEAVEREAEEQ